MKNVRRKPTVFAAVHRVMETLCGPENARPAHKILEMAGYPGVTNATARGIIRATITARRVPIGANGSGYYMLQSEADMLEYMQRLNNRIEQMNSRRQALYHAWFTHPVPLDELEPKPVV